MLAASAPLSSSLFNASSGYQDLVILGPKVTTDIKPSTS